MSLASLVLRDSNTYDFGNYKEQMSGDSPKSIISSRLGECFPFFPRRRNHRKNDSKIADETLCISALPRPLSTRSSSLNRKTSRAGAEAIAQSEVNDQIKFASTPLLPPMVTTVEQKEIQSPLPSPTVAESDANFSVTSVLADAPLLHGIPSLPLLKKPSIGSMHRTGVSASLSSAELPPLLIGDTNDEWSIKLGHANFTISPQPYVPKVCDAEAYRKILLDWEQARTNWFKHQHRTLVHYGLNSETYKLTVQKWAEIDVEWKRCNDQAAAEAVRTSEEALPMAPLDHPPTSPMPVVHDLDGKFPKHGDEDIVGPMKQAAVRIQPSPPRKYALNKLFEYLKIHIL